jgi:CelD/BcsL family acetyltransferase involved in cellulose biosynthesis
MLRIKEISSYEEFRALKDAWSDLMSKGNLDNLYLTHDWIDPYIRNCCNGDRLVILTVFDGSILIGIAPLMIKKYSFMGIIVKSVCFIGTGESDRMDFIISALKEKCILSIMDYLMDINKDWDFLDLQEVPESSGTLETIEKWVNLRKLKFIPTLQDKTFFVKLNSNADFLLKKVSKKLDTKMKKLNKKDRASLEFRRYVPDEAKESLFSDIQFIARRSWKAKKQKSIFLKKRIKSFHRELFSRFAESGYLDVSILSIDDTPIAYIYNFLYSSRLYNYSIDFDMRYSHISPGTILMLWIIKDSVLRGIKEIDFGRGDEAWKARLTQDFRMQTKVRIFNNSFYGKCLYLLYSGIGFIKGHKIIYKILKAMKERFL